MLGLRGKTHKGEAEMKTIKDDDGNEYAEIDVKNTGEGPLSVWFDDGDKKFNIPKSVMEDWPNLNETGTALVQIWFAEMRGLV